MRRLVAVIFALAIVASLSGQALDVARLDFSQAKLSFAGRDAIYVRSIYYAGVELSVRLVYDGATGVTVEGPYYDDSQKILKDYYEIGYAKMQRIGTNLLEISNIILWNTAYSGRLRWDGSNRMVLAEPPRQTPMPKTYEQQIAELQQQVSRGNEYRDWGQRVNAELETAKMQLREANVKAASAQAAADKAKVDLASAQASADRAATDLAAARRAAAAASATTGAVAAAPAWRTVFGPAEGERLRPVTFGTWKPAIGSLSQTDGSQKYAKYAVPFAQSATHTLYGFSAKAGATGWVGFGLHFFASGAKSAGSYGFGKSYLVWLTRDEGYYRTKKAYVQLYQSSDDVTMIQLASANIGLDLTQPVNTEVVYNKDTRSIEVYVNGELSLIQEVEPIASGDSLAARTLGGGVMFTNFYVKTY